jgi:hypothetical protein
MIEVRATVELPIAMDGRHVFMILADFVDHHWRILPSACTGFEVLSGGYGEGTEVTFMLGLYRLKHLCIIRYSEPIRGKVLTGFESRSRSLVTWRVRDVSHNCLVQLEITAHVPDNLSIITSRVLLPFQLRRMLKQTLTNLETYAPTVQMSLPSPRDIPARSP